MHWGRRHELRAGRPERLLKNAVTELHLEALLEAAEQRVRELERRAKSGGLQSAQETGLVPSPSELELLRRTGPILLPGLAPANPPANPRLVPSPLQESYDQSRNVTWNQ